MKIQGKHIFDTTPQVEGLGNLALAVDVAGKAPLVHTHPISDIVNLQSTLNNKAALIHTHVIGDVFLLQNALDGKANVSHSHVISDVTGLQTALDGKANTSHSHAISDVTGLQTALDGKAALSHSHAISDVTGLQTALDGKQSLNTLGSKLLSSIAQNPGSTQDKWHLIYDATNGNYTIAKDFNALGYALIDTLSALNTLTYNDELTQIYYGSTWGKQTCLGNVSSFPSVRNFIFVNNSIETISILYSDFTEAFRLEPYNTLEAYLIDKSTANGTWAFFVKRPVWLNEMYDNFIATSTAGQTTWAVVNATQLAAASGNPTGGIQLSTGNTATGVGSIIKNGLMIQLGANQGVFVDEWRFQIPTLSDGTNTFNVKIGFGDVVTAGTDIVDGIIIEYNGTNPNWIIKASSNNTRSTLISSIAVDTGWHHVKIETNHNSTNAWLFLDDVLLGSISTNIPTGTGRQTSMMAKINKTVGTTARLLNLDHTNFRNYLT